MQTSDGAVRRWHAIFPVLAVGLLVTAGALMPSGLDQPIRSLDTARSQLAAASAHSGTLYLCTGLIILGLGSLAVSFPAIATLCPDRRSATLATAIAGLACISGVAVNSLVNLNVAGAVRAPVSRDAAARLLLAVNTTTLPTAYLISYVAGLVAASVLLGIALWRAKTLPGWLAALFPVALILASTAPPGLLGVILSIPFTTVMILLAVKLWRRLNTAHIQPPPRTQTMDPIR